MCKIIQRPDFPIWQSHIWIIARRCEYGKTLDMNIRNVLFAGKSMSANRMRKSMNNKISFSTGFFSLLQDFRTNADRMAHEFTKQFDEIMAPIIKSTT